MRSTLHHSARRALLALAFLAAAFAIASTRAEAAPVAAAQAHFMWGQYDAADINQQLDAAKAAGIGMLRVDVGWSGIEQDGKGQYNKYYLDKLDSVVAGANARGIGLLLTFWQTPCWASSAPDSLKQNCSGSWWNRGVERYAPNNPQDYADALAFLAGRYGDRVTAWEIWNEPNQDDFFKAGDPVSAYASLVKAAYPAAKAADPNTVVVAGSLANADFDFTQKLYDHGVKGNFDAWSVHPYSDDRSPLDPADDNYIQNSFVRGVPAVHDTMVRNGDDKPLWLTEFGWSTCTVRNSPEHWRNCVDESTQASYLRTAFHQMRNWSYVPVGVWFNLEDTSGDTSSRVDNYGLLHTDGTPKPAYDAFRQAAADFAGGPLPTAGSGAGNASGSGSGSSSDSTLTPQSDAGIKLVVKRGSRAVVARGRAPGASMVVLFAYRYDSHKHRWHKRLRSKVRTDVRGRFVRRFSPRLFTRGKWKLVAHAPSPRLREAGVRLRIR